MKDAEQKNHQDQDWKTSNSTINFNMTLLINDTNNLFTWITKSILLLCINSLLAIRTLSQNALVLKHHSHKLTEHNMHMFKVWITSVKFWRKQKTHPNWTALDRASSTYTITNNNQSQHTVVSNNILQYKQFILNRCACAASMWSSS